ncbi:MAG: discoidin domain-containing protein, partial [Bacillota bacterium]|nr:discoidin domain-containing protein [Bacillota bacterium]
EDGKVTGHDECPHVITVDFGKSVAVSGWRYTARTDTNSGIVNDYNIYASTDGKTFNKIYTGSFPKFGVNEDYKTNPVKTASWGDTPMRTIKIEITSSISGYGTAAEINFLTGGKADGAKTDSIKTDSTKTETDSTKTQTVRLAEAEGYVDRSLWKVQASSDLGSTVQRVLDNNTGTFWHTHYTAEGSTITEHDTPPFTLEFTLPEVTAISGVSILPRQVGNTGMIQKVNLYVSDSDTGEYFLLKENVEFNEESFSEKRIPFSANIKVKHIKLEVLASIGSYGTMAEFYAFSEDKGKPTVSYQEFNTYESEHKLYEIDNTAFIATYEGNNWGGNTPPNMFDGSIKTFWQTEPTQDSVMSFNVDMKAVNRVTEIHYTPRQTDDHDGLWKEVKIWGGTDPNNMEPLKDVTLAETLDKKVIAFDSPITVRYLCFEVLQYVDKRISCAELSFWQDKASKDAMKKKEMYNLKIGSNVIASEGSEGKIEKAIDVAPYIVNGSTLIPLRGLLEQMGASIQWDGVKQKIYITNGDYKITLQICNKLVYVEDPRYGSIRYTLLNFPVIKDSRTFIPVRFISEQLGYKVDWNSETQTVTITK